MVKYDFLKRASVIHYIKPKVYWGENTGLRVGKSSSEMMRYKIANYKRYFAENSINEIFYYWNYTFLFIGLLIGYNTFKKETADKNPKFQGLHVVRYFERDSSG